MNGELKQPKNNRYIVAETSLYESLQLSKWDTRQATDPLTPQVRTSIVRGYPSGMTCSHFDYFEAIPNGGWFGQVPLAL